MDPYGGKYPCDTIAISLTVNNIDMVMLLQQLLYLSGLGQSRHISHLWESIGIFFNGKKGIEHYILNSSRKKVMYINPTHVYWTEHAVWSCLSLKGRVVGTSPPTCLDEEETQNCWWTWINYVIIFLEDIALQNVAVTRQIDFYKWVLCCIFIRCAG